MISEILIMLFVEILLIGGVLSVVALGMVLNRTHQRNRRYSEPSPDAPLAPVIHWFSDVPATLRRQDVGLGRTDGRRFCDSPARSGATS